ncbi:MAG: hypothetical protein IMW97_01300 [Firmicutes bacterium]|nr:hypothetical protein [Candidatus Fermentithermobacillaceae bacterium]
MWLIAYYRPVGLFSLKAGPATSTGAKTVFLPTPFAIRTALLDAAIRTQGLQVAPRFFRMLKTVAIAALVPERVVVTNLFAKVRKPRRAEAEREGAMQSTIAFREYAYLMGNLGLGFRGEEVVLDELEALLPQISYFGKRGSFFQLLSAGERTTELPAGFVVLRGISATGTQIGSQVATSFKLGIIQVLDDWGPELTFEKVNTYSDRDIRLGRDRIRESVILPYRLVRSSRSFSYYERI